MQYEYRPATMDDLERIWARNIQQNAEDPCWSRWRDEYIGYNRNGQAQTYVVVCNGDPVGEGTLLFSPECGAIAGRTLLADGATVANINALRIDRACFLLRDPSYSISQIAYLCGYGNPRTFHRAFLSQCHMPPKQYRARMNVHNVLDDDDDDE
mgnify:CR=1 FL=1